MSDLQSDELRGAPPVENYQDRDFCWADEQEPAFEEHQVPSQLLESSVNTRPYRHALKFEFPFKLHELLEDAATRDGNEHIVSWHPDGKAFTIHLKEEFETQIIPQYFPKAPKFRSFCRQLSIYGYKMDQDASSKYFRAYRHPLMVRGNPGLCAWMVREKVKGSSASKTRISQEAAFSRSQQEYNMEDESFVQQEETTTADHTVSLHGVQQEGDISRDHSIEDGLLEFAITANAYLEDSSSSEISSPVAAAAKHPHQAADEFFSTTTGTSDHHNNMFLTHQPNQTKMILQSFNDDPLVLEAKTSSCMYNHVLQGSESMILEAIRQILSPHRQSISSASSFRSS